MAITNPGPYDIIPWNGVPFPGGEGTCPTILPIKAEILSYGPGWRANHGVSGSYTSNCNTSWKYVLNYVKSYKASTVTYLNKVSVPNSWWNQQGISSRYPLRILNSDPAEYYDAYGNTIDGAQYTEYHDEVQNPDGTWNYQKTLWKTTMSFTSVPSYDNICPHGTVYNPNTGTCDVLPGYEWDENSGGYVGIVELPNLPVGIGHPPTYPPNEDLQCPPCYVYDSELNLCVYNPLEAGCEDLLINCVPIGGCEISLSVVLEPIDLDKILPPGYLESGGLKLQPTGKPIDSNFEPVESIFDPDTGECIVLNNCE